MTASGVQIRSLGGTHPAGQQPRPDHDVVINGTLHHPPAFWPEQSQWENPGDHRNLRVETRPPAVRPDRRQGLAEKAKKKTPAPEGARVCRRMGEGLGAGG